MDGHFDSRQEVQPVKQLLIIHLQQGQTVSQEDVPFS